MLSLHHLWSATGLNSLGCTRVDTTGTLTSNSDALASAPPVTRTHRQHSCRLHVTCVDKTGTLTSNTMAAVRAAAPTTTGVAALTLTGSAGIQVICVDKTGTLTSNTMAAVRAAAPTTTGVAAFTLTGSAGHAPRHIVATGTAQRVAEPAEVQGLLYLALCSALCNDSALSFDEHGVPKHLGDGTEVALRLFAEGVGLPGGAERQVRSTGNFCQNRSST